MALDHFVSIIYIEIMEPTKEDIIIELVRQGVPEKYYSEVIDIVINRIQRTNCALIDAVIFAKKWVNRYES